MHDLYDHKFYKGNVEEKLKETLEQLGIYPFLSKEDIENIIYSCANLGFSSNISSKKELSKEGKIAQDADRLDAIGAIGIARTFAYGGKKGRLLYDPTNNEMVNSKEYNENGSKTSISHFYDKLLKLKELMNTSLGCSSECSYCYLGKMGYDNKTNILEVKKAEELIEQIEKIGILGDTLITLGCFSECWDNNNKSETIKLIQYFLSKGNQVQLATKKQINYEELESISKLIQYVGQLLIFISSATISNWESIERGTESPEKRFKTFEISKKLNIPTILYMKPILKGITIKDIELYKDVIKQYGIKDVVVGSIFSEEKSNETVHFSDRGLLFYNPVSDELEIKQKLMEQGNIRVFSRSSQVAQYYKDRNKDFIIE